MSGSSHQKLKLLYLIRILREKSDEDHPLNAVDLIAELRKLGISAERKSIYSDIQLMNDFKLDVVQTNSPKQGWFLASREFELPEIRLLMDAVQSASFITKSKTNELLTKLEAQMSHHQIRELKQQVYIESRVKCANEKIYYIIDEIHRAIGQNRQVDFMYFRREVGLSRVARNQGNPFVVSPYAMIWANDHYYLVGNLSKYNTLTHFRLDRMQNVEMTNELCRGFEEVSEYRNSFDAADYARKSFSMFGGETQQIQLKCANRILEEIVDRFGDDVSIRKDGNDYFRVSVKAHGSIGFVSWALQFGTDIEVISPLDLRCMVRDRIKGMEKMYP